MWKIKYQDKFLDIKRDQTAEIERVSPLYMLEELLSEKSTPIEFVFSNTNSSVFGHIFFDKTIKKQLKLSVELFINDSFFSLATLVIESAGMDRRHIKTGTCQGYLLVGISNFFAEIKDKKMTELTLGGERVFNYTTDDPTDGSSGYWQHVMACHDFSQDYIFPIFRNDAITEDDIEHTYSYYFINSCWNDVINTTQPICPWPKLEYVIRKAFEENGWKLDTSMIDGSGWEKIVLYSYYLISTNTYIWSGTEVTANHISSITIDLSKAMPQDVNISSWIFAICKRYFWAPICDIGSRTCKLFPLRDIRNAMLEDWSEIAEPASSSSFSTEAKIWAFKNNFTGQDEYPSGLDVSSYEFVNPVDLRQQLPDPEDGSFDKKLYFVFSENTYYTVIYDSTANTRSWQPFGRNIYSVEPSDATDTVETDASPMPTIRQQMPNGHYGYVSIVSQVRNTNWGIRTALYHGLTKYINGGDDSPLGVEYPCAISSNTPPALVPQLPWSDVWFQNDFVKDWGIVQTWGRKWIDANEYTEVIQRVINLKLYKQLTFKWESIKLIENIPHLVKSFLHNSDSPDSILATLVKMKLVNYAVIGEPPTDPTTRFNGYQLTLAAKYQYVATQYVKGSPGAVVTIEIIDIVETFGYDFYEKVNGSFVNEGDTFTVTLDANGDGYFTIDMGGVNVDGKAVLIKFEIIATTIDVIGTPYLAQHSKITG